MSLDAYMAPEPPARARKSSRARKGPPLDADDTPYNRMEEWEYRFLGQAIYPWTRDIRWRPGIIPRKYGYWEYVAEMDRKYARMLNGTGYATGVYTCRLCGGESEWSDRNPRRLFRQTCRCGGIQDVQVLVPMWDTMADDSCDHDDMVLLT